MQVGLFAKQPFNAFGHQAVTGSQIPDDVWMKWMEHDPHAVTNRLRNDFVEWKPVAEATDVVNGRPAFDAMDKDLLSEFAATELETKLDGRSTIETLRAQVGAQYERHQLLTSLRGKQEAARAETRAIEATARTKTSAPAAPPAAVVALATKLDPAHATRDPGALAASLGSKAAAARGRGKAPAGTGVAGEGSQLPTLDGDALDQQETTGTTDPSADGAAQSDTPPAGGVEG